MDWAYFLRYYHLHQGLFCSTNILFESPFMIYLQIISHISYNSSTPHQILTYFWLLIQHFISATAHYSCHHKIASSFIWIVISCVAWKLWLKFRYATLKGGLMVFGQRPRGVNNEKIKKCICVFFTCFDITVIVWDQNLKRVATLKDRLVC